MRKIHKILLQGSHNSSTVLHINLPKLLILGILKWFPVISTRTYWVCPLEVAVETMLQTNEQLQTTILEARADSAPLHPLSMRLQG